MDVRCIGCGQKVGEREPDGEVVIHQRVRSKEYRIIRAPRSVQCERCGAVTQLEQPAAA